MSTPAPGRPTGRPTLALVFLVVVLVLTGASACSQEFEEPPKGLVDRTDSVTLTSQPVTTRGEVAHVYGRLPKQRRAAVRRKVTALVDAWWEAAYLGGDYPRATFPDAFPGFTRGAEARARGDKLLMTNRDIGQRTDSVAARHRHVAMDVLAVKGVARSVTARFVLRFRTAGDETSHRVQVRGRLFLTRRHGDWRIFGYDVSKGSRA